MSIILKVLIYLDRGFSRFEMFEKLDSYLFKNKICPNMEHVVCSLRAVLA